LNKISVINDPVSRDSETAKAKIAGISGTVNVATGSIYVTGTNTKFNVATSSGAITIGSYIAVNSQIRVISSVISNTNLAVTSAFTITANNEEMVVMNTVYSSITTELSEEITTEDEFSLLIES
jgi:hypothetical protein